MGEEGDGGLEDWGDGVDGSEVGRGWGGGGE